MPYDEKSAGIVGRLRTEVEAMGLHFFVARRLLGILNALEMNVEEGHPNQETVGFLFQALTAEAKSLPEPSQNNLLTAINRCRGALAARQTSGRPRGDRPASG